jgi:hypothetical protein
LLAHRALAAFRFASDLSSGVIFAVRAFPLRAAAPADLDRRRTLLFGHAGMVA